VNKLCHYMQNYLLYGFVLVVALLVWGIGIAYFSPLYLISDSNIVVRIIHELLSYNFMLWFSTLVLYMVFLVVVPNFREKTLRRLANLQERDEREEYLTGKAARASYMATLSLTLFFLFFSFININFSKLNPTDPQKSKHSMSVGIHYSFFNKSETKESSNEQVTTIFDTRQFSLSGSTIFLMFLGWQLFVFNLVAKRERLRNL
jgi:hypothetical protein